MVTLFLQNNCSKWLNNFGTNSQKKKIVSEQAREEEQKCIVGSSVK